jgi:membrane protease YdiL (CAAX protease family)
VAISVAVLTIGQTRRYCDPGQLRGAVIAGAAAVAVAILTVRILRRSYGWSRLHEVRAVAPLIAVVAFGEELLFRGVLLRLIAGSWGMVVAIGASSVMFGAAHHSRARPYDALVHVFTGMSFGVVAWISGGWLASAAVHLVYNCVAFEWRPAKYVNQRAGRMIAPQALP